MAEGPEQYSGIEDVTDRLDVSAHTVFTFLLSANPIL